MIGQHFLRNLVERRSLLAQLVRRDFEQRYVGSIAGWLWGLVHPLVLILSWTFVFQYCLRTPMPPGEVTGNYSIFLVCGFLPWMLFQETVTRSANCIVENANLITKTVFPSEILPLSVFLSSLLNHLMALVLTLAVIGVWLQKFSPMVLTLPLYMLLVGLFAVGIAWIVAAVQVYLRDTAQLVSVALTFWFWLTPIFLSAEQFPPNFRFLLAINPLSYFVGAYRERMLSYRLPHPEELALLAAYSVAVFFLGGLFFRHLKRGFADVL